MHTSSGSHLVSYLGYSSRSTFWIRCCVKMEITILEYKGHQGNKVKVQSHNYHKGKWVVNPCYKFHCAIAEQDAKYTFGTHPTVYKKYTKRQV